MVKSCLALFGKTGTGKTTLVEAIADKTNRDLETITSWDIDVSGCASASIVIANRLRKIESSGRKTIIFFDWFDTLVRSYSDSDADHNAAFLMNYFDKIEKEQNYNIFCILATDSFSNVPKSMIRYLRDVTFEITDLTDPVLIQKCFDIGLRNDRLIIHQEVKEYLMQRLERFNFCNPGYIRGITNRIVNTSFIRRERPVVMTREDIDDAIKHHMIFLKISKEQ